MDLALDLALARVEGLRTPIRPSIFSCSRGSILPGEKRDEDKEEDDDEKEEVEEEEEALLLPCTAAAATASS